MKPRSSSAYEFMLVALLVLFWGSVGLNRVGIGLIFPDIVPEFHMAYWQASLLVAGTSVTWAVSSWVGGWLSDRHGRRRVLLPAAAWVCVMTAAMGATWSFLSMFVVRDLLGIGDGVGWAVGESAISEESAPQRRGFNQALFTAGYTLIGAGLGAVIITRISHYLGWRWVFPIIGGATVFVVLGLAVVMREPPAQKARHKLDWRASLATLKSPSLIHLTVMGCAILTWLAVTIAFNQLFLTKLRGFSKLEAGDIAVVWGLAGTAGQILLPLASDYVGRRPVTLVSALVSAAALAAYIAGGFGLGGMQLMLGINGFCGFGLLPIVLATCVSESVGEEVRGAALGATNFFAVIVGTTLMPVIGGVMADHFGLGSAMWILVGAQIVIALFILAIDETAPRLVARRAAALRAAGD
ncbi:MAG TPA: MFS transporter [Stellaceae bacterium]|nr:MFS transporter [Stellaceae bacterium]